MLPPPEDRLDGLHDTDASPSGGSSVTEAVCVLLLNDAVTTTVWVLPIVPAAVALKLALVAPLEIDTEAGTVRPVLLSLTVTVVLPGAG